MLNNQIEKECRGHTRIELTPPGYQYDPFNSIKHGVKHIVQTYRTLVIVRQRYYIFSFFNI